MTGQLSTNTRAPVARWRAAVLAHQFGPRRASSAITLAMTLSALMRIDGSCRVGIEWLQRHTQMAEATVYGARRRLGDAGLLAWVPGVKNRPTLYQARVGGNALVILPNEQPVSPQPQGTESGLESESPVSHSETPQHVALAERRAIAKLLGIDEESVELAS